MWTALSGVGIASAVLQYCMRATLLSVLPKQHHHNKTTQHQHWKPALLCLQARTLHRTDITLRKHASTIQYNK